MRNDIRRESRRKELKEMLRKRLETNGSIRRHTNGLLDVRPYGEYIKIAQENAIRSPLLRLPAELRNKISKYVFGGRTITIKIGLTYAAYLSNPGRMHYAGLLGACRQTYAENALLPFSENVFMDENGYEMVEFMMGRIQVEREAVTAVRVIARIFEKKESKKDWFSDSDWVNKTIPFPGLKRIRVDIMSWPGNSRKIQASFDRAKADIETLYSGVEVIVDFGIDRYQASSSDSNSD